MDPQASSPAKLRQILGVQFFTGSVGEAVALALRGGLVVAPSAPVLCAMSSDLATREALLNCDLSIADSGLMVLLWNLLERDNVQRVSGLGYIKLLLAQPELKAKDATFWVMPSGSAMERNITWLQKQGHQVSEENCYIAPHYGPGAVTDTALLERVIRQKPSHIIMAIGGGVQERVAYYLKAHTDFRPGIHCTGAAIGFLTGDQTNIPNWADKYFLGWLIRCLASPTQFIPRYWKARKLIWMILTARGNCP